MVVEILFSLLGSSTRARRSFVEQLCWRLEVFETLDGACGAGKKEWMNKANRFARYRVRVRFR